MPQAQVLPSVFPKLTMEAELDSGQKSDRPQLVLNFTLELPTFESLWRRVTGGGKEEGSAPPPQQQQQKRAEQQRQAERDATQKQRDVQDVAGIGDVRALLAAANAWEAKRRWEEDWEDEVHAREKRKHEKLFTAGLEANRAGKTAEACRLLHQAALVRSTPSMILSVANMHLKLKQALVALPLYDFVLRSRATSEKEVRMARDKQTACLQMLNQLPGSSGAEEAALQA